MKKSSLFSVLALVAIAFLSVAVQACGIDVSTLITPEVAAGLSMAGAAGIVNCIQEGETLTLTPTAAVASGVGYMFGTSLFGVATADVAANVAGEFLTKGVFNLAKTDSLAIAVGDRVFWDATNKCVNKTTTDQVCVGICVEAVANTAGLVKVKVKLGSYLPAAT